MFHVYKKYLRGRSALRDVNLQVDRGEFAFLVGPSGAGKTTLLKLLFCAEQATEGQILVNGRNIHRLAPRHIPYFRREIGVVFQDFKLLPRYTVFENVALALQIMGFPLSAIRKKVHQTLRYLGLADKERYYPPQLSGGEQQRVAIARAIVNSPLILLADEPTGNLDAHLTMEIMALLKEIHARGTTVVVATHSRELLKNTVRRIISLDRGKTV